MEFLRRNIFNMILFLTSKNNCHKFLMQAANSLFYVIENEIMVKSRANPECNINTVLVPMVLGPAEM